MDPTTRLKTSGTIIEKLRREAPITLRSIRDLAGARIVQPMTLSEQDAVRDRILGLWPDAKVIDRRETPSFGYRAVHLVPRIDGCYVEIQLRTLYQDTWAQLMERLGDTFGRAIRYGGEPDDPDLPIADNHPTRHEVVDVVLRMSPKIAALESLEDRRVGLKGLDPEALARMDLSIEEAKTAFRELRAAVAEK